MFKNLSFCKNAKLYCFGARRQIKNVNEKCSQLKSCWKNFSTSSTKHIVSYKRFFAKLICWFIIISHALHISTWTLLNVVTSMWWYIIWNLKQILIILNMTKSNQYYFLIECLSSSKNDIDLSNWKWSNWYK